MILTHLSATPEPVSIYKTELQPNQPRLKILGIVSLSDGGEKVGSRGERLFALMGVGSRK